MKKKLTNLIKNLKPMSKSSSKPLKDPIVKNSIHWVGHSTVVINLNDKIIVTDPVTSGALGHIRRLINPSMDLSKLHIDYILLSHGHRDHLDANTLRKINRDAVIITPGGFSQVMTLLGFGKIITATAGYRIKLKDISIDVLEPCYMGKLSYLGKRYVGNSYVINSDNFKIFFAGATGYTSKFKNLDVDVALMPVGCYKTDEILKSHCSPSESFKMFKEMNGKIMIPIHYNTFIPSQESDAGTISMLNELNDGSIKILKIGETYKL
ncbi:MBL fold metallo-hydrolase [Clostridium rectalis]|uniref:MBL fold metallo-hydrolase n=1 Tax=Clostridium rectalis TaxID=2040295 RepID=UPI000F6429A8|nr:MBL fold metallo-hydrolase [Clostridium rectalis]